jgi:hypothetical protein
MERIHRGATIEWKDWQDDICGDDRVRYTELIETVWDVPTVTKVTIRPFETIGAGAHAFVADFFDLVGQRQLVETLDPDVFRPSNPSYTEPALRAAMALNPLLDTDKQLKRVRRFLRRLFPQESYPKPQLLGDEERQALLERYRPENERLFSRYLPEYPVDAYWNEASLARLRQMQASQTDGP